MFLSSESYFGRNIDIYSGLIILGVMNYLFFLLFSGYELGERKKNKGFVNLLIIILLTLIGLSASYVYFDNKKNKQEASLSFDEHAEKENELSQISLKNENEKKMMCKEFINPSLSTDLIEDVFEKKQMYEIDLIDKKQMYIPFTLNDYEMDFSKELGFNFLSIGTGFEPDLMDSTTPVLPYGYFGYDIPSDARNIDITIEVSSCVEFENVRIPGFTRKLELLGQNGLGNFVPLEKIKTFYPDEEIVFELSNNKENQLAHLIIKPYHYKALENKLYLFNKFFVVIRYDF